MPQENDLFLAKKRAEELNARVNVLSAARRGLGRGISRPPGPVGAPAQSLQSPPPKATTSATTAALEQHDTTKCDLCGMFPILGPCYTKRDNTDFDACKNCFIQHIDKADWSLYMRVKRPNASAGPSQPASASASAGPSQPASASAGSVADDMLGVDPDQGGDSTSGTHAEANHGSGSKRSAEVREGTQVASKLPRPAPELSELSLLRLTDSGSDAGSEPESSRPGGAVSNDRGRTLHIHDDTFTLRLSAIHERVRASDGKWYYYDIYWPHGTSCRCLLFTSTSITCAGGTKTGFVRFPTEDRPTKEECGADVARFTAALREQLGAFRRNSTPVRARAMAFLADTIGPY